MRVLVAMLGNRRHYLVPELIEELGALSVFVTDFFIRPNGWLRAGAESLGRGLKIKRLRALAGRNSPRIPISRVVSLQSLGLYYAFRRFAGDADARLFASINRRFCRRARSHLRSIDVCWAYNGAATRAVRGGASQEYPLRARTSHRPARIDELREIAQAQQDWPAWHRVRDSARQSSTDPLSGASKPSGAWLMYHCRGSRYVGDCLEKTDAAPAVHGRAIGNRP